MEVELRQQNKTHLLVHTRDIIRIFYRSQFNYVKTVGFRTNVSILLGWFVPPTYLKYLRLINSPHNFINSLFKHKKIKCLACWIRILWGWQQRWRAQIRFAVLLLMMGSACFPHSPMKLERSRHSDSCEISLDRHNRCFCPAYLAHHCTLFCHNNRLLLELSSSFPNLLVRPYALAMCHYEVEWLAHLSPSANYRLPWLLLYRPLVKAQASPRANARYTWSAPPMPEATS